MPGGGDAKLAVLGPDLMVASMISMVQCSKDEGILRVKINFIDWEKDAGCRNRGYGITDFDPSVAAKTSHNQLNSLNPLLLVEL